MSNVVTVSAQPLVPHLSSSSSSSLWWQPTRQHLPLCSVPTYIEIAVSPVYLTSLPQSSLQYTPPFIHSAILYRYSWRENLKRRMEGRGGGIMSSMNPPSLPSLQKERGESHASFLVLFLFYFFQRKLLLQRTLLLFYLPSFSVVYVQYTVRTPTVQE